MDNFDPYNVLLSIATNIPVLLMTAFVLQAHIYIYIYTVAEKCKTNHNSENNNVSEIINNNKSEKTRTNQNLIRFNELC